MSQSGLLNKQPIFPQVFFVLFFTLGGIKKHLPVMKMHESENNCVDKLPCVSCQPCSFCFHSQYDNYPKTFPGHSLIVHNVSEYTGHREFAPAIKEMIVHRYIISSETIGLSCFDSGGNLHK